MHNLILYANVVLRKRKANWWFFTYQVVNLKMVYHEEALSVPANVNKSRIYQIKSQIYFQIHASVLMTHVFNASNTI